MRTAAVFEAGIRLCFADAVVLAAPDGLFRADLLLCVGFLPDADFFLGGVPERLEFGFVSAATMLTSVSYFPNSSAVYHTYLCATPKYARIHISTVTIVNTRTIFFSLQPLTWKW